MHRQYISYRPDNNTGRRLDVTATVFVILKFHRNIIYLGVEHLYIIHMNDLKFQRIIVIFMEILDQIEKCPG